MSDFLVANVLTNNLDDVVIAQKHADQPIQLQVYLQDIDVMADFHLIRFNGFHADKSHFVDAMTREHIAVLVERYPDIEEVWLIGSRAEGLERASSDWDYLVFANVRLLNSLRQKPELNRPDVDLLVVYDGDRFKSPWRDGKRVKFGSLTQWDWKVVGRDEATYRATSWRSDSDFNVNVRVGRGRRVWKKALK